ncbi:MAG: translin [Archaeoglobaceae archaeon]
MDIEIARQRLEELDAAREELIKLTREMRINATRAVAAIHSGGDADEYIEKARELLQRILEYRRYPEIFYQITHDAMQELVEAVAFAKIVRGEFSFVLDLEVTPSAFVTGLADVVGELRRYALTKLVEGDFAEAERLMKLMEEIYSALISFTSLPDRLVPNLRPKLDVARAAIERTKSDYIAAKVARLHESLGGD